MLRRIQLYARTLPHLRPWQIAGRVLATLRRRIGFVPLPDPPEALGGTISSEVPFPNHDPWNSRADVLEGRFCFLNRQAALGKSVDWSAPNLPLLWRFNLHYFNYLHLLENDEQVTLCRSWVDGNLVGEGPGWHPYPTSLRIVNWCKANLQDHRIQQNLYLQAAFLFRNLETYVYGNHLLENARALVYAGRFFGDAGESRRWLERGLELYRRETALQILPDGMHFERSPMYHALMLEGYLDVVNLLPPDHPDRTLFVPTIRQMSDVLATMTHPDGHITLFNDATQEIAPSAKALQEYVHRLIGHVPQRVEHLPDAGYYAFRNGDLYLVIDGGRVGPEHLMAHAHADIFSFELSIGRLQFFVDTGVNEYTAGPSRSRVRSTAAHNTVSVDGLDQVECWDSFRVARRWEPSDVHFGTDAEKTSFRGTFDGYAHLLGYNIRHRRTVDIFRNRRQVHIEDDVTGSGKHRVEARFHLHPDVEVNLADAVVLRRGGVSCRLEVEGGEIRWEKGAYCPRFGVQIPNSVAVIGGELQLPVRFSVAIKYGMR